MKLMDDGTYWYLLGIDNGYKLKINGEMTPKEKAEELVSKMNVIHYMKLHGKNKYSKGLPISMYDDQIKQCALIAVDEIINVARYEFHIKESFNQHETVEYWQDVKQEIEKL